MTTVDATTTTGNGQNGISLPVFPDAHLLTHSAETTFRTCARRYQLKYELGLAPAHQSEPLRLGNAVHVGLEVLKQGGDEQQAAARVRDEYAGADCPPYMDATAFAVEEETAVAIVRAYARRWGSDAIVEYLAVEVAFDLPVMNPYTGRELRGIRNAGKIDGIARLPDGRVALVEHKTTSDDVGPASDYWTTLRMDHQISRYVLAARAMGYAVETTVYDVIRKPAIKPKAVAKAERARATADGYYFGLPLTAMCPERETPAMYGARLLDDMSSRPEHYFARNEIARLESDLDQFAFDQWHTLKLIETSRLDGYWPRNTAACMRPYRCAFIDVCRGLTSDPEQEIPAGFRRADVLHPELATATNHGADE